MTSTDTLENVFLLMWSGANCFTNRSCPLPGQLLEQLPQGIRESLKELRSDDLLKLRPDYVRQFLRCTKSAR